MAMTILPSQSLEAMFHLPVSCVSVMHDLLQDSNICFCCSAVNLGHLPWT